MPYKRGCRTSNMSKETPTYVKRDLWTVWRTSFYTRNIKQDIVPQTRQKRPLNVWKETHKTDLLTIEWTSCKRSSSKQAVEPQTRQIFQKRPLHTWKETRKRDLRLVHTPQARFLDTTHVKTDHYICEKRPAKETCILSITPQARFLDATNMLKETPTYVKRHPQKRPAFCPPHLRHDF